MNSRAFKDDLGTFPLAVRLGLSVGAVDLALGLLERPVSLANFLTLFPPLVATATAAFLVYLVVRRAFRPIERKLALNDTACSLALAGWILLSFTLVRLSGVLETRIEPPALFKLLLVLALAVALAATGYVAADALSRSGRLRWLSGMALALPLVLLQLVMFEWLELFWSQAVTSISSVVLSVLTLVSMVVTLRLAFGVAGTARSSRTAVAVAVFLVCVPLVGLIYRSAVSSTPRVVSDDNRSPKHVLLVSVDTLRADVLSCYGSTLPTPHIDALAEDGMVFENVTAAAPWTLASLASILTGLSPDVHSLTEIKSRLPDALTTVAERMRQNGYTTGAVVLNNLLHPRANLDQGFDEYGFLREPSYGGVVGAEILQALFPSAYPSHPWPSTDEVTRIAIDWLDRHESSDFFFWLHYYDPHTPLTPPPRYLESLTPPPGMGLTFYAQKDVMAGTAVPNRAQRHWIEALYRAEVRYLDDNVGKLIADLKRRGIYDDALIVFTSDHGEEFWEHGAFGHGHSLYNEVLSVPLIVKLPGSKERGRVGTRVTNASVAPTILELAGVELGDVRVSGRTLVPLLEGEEGIEEQPIVSTAPVLFDKGEAVFFDGMKYLRSTIGTEEELYDLREDPGEGTSLLSTLPEQAERGRHLLREHHELSQKLRKRFGIEDVEEVQFDDDTLRQLKALGYVH